MCSSANLSPCGTEFRAEDVEPTVLAIADFVVDHGVRKCHYCCAASSLLDIRNCRVDIDMQAS